MQTPPRSVDGSVEDAAQASLEGMGTGDVDAMVRQAWLGLASSAVPCAEFIPRSTVDISEGFDVGFLLSLFVLL